MKKFLAVLMVAALLSLANAVYAAGEGENQTPLLGVNNWKGNHVGFVNHVLVEPSTGNIIFAILYLEKERKEITVPVAAFSSFDWEKGALVLRVSEKELASAPEFHDSDLSDPAYAERVYKFFGLAPSWTDQTQEKDERL
jgi:hypothetical protein